MRLTLPRLVSVSLCGLALLVAPFAGRTAPLSDDDVKFMTIYEQTLKAFVTDNLNARREAFFALSQTAEKKVAGNPDFHVFYCPMTKGNWVWVQATATIANPYMGKDMLTCGVEKKNN